MPDPAAFIAANLPVRPVPDLPHIRLHTAVPESGVWRLAEGGTPPYWAWPWPGGLALAHHLHAHPELVSGKTVLDLGTGSGLVAIAAALAGAKAVTACDPDPAAIAAVTLNASLNGVPIVAQAGDPLDGPPPEAEIILVGDLFYAADLARRVTAYLDRCVGAGRTVYVGDIGRAHLPHNRLTSLARYPLADFGEPATGALHLARVCQYKLPV